MWDFPHQPNGWLRLTDGVIAPRLRHSTSNGRNKGIGHAMRSAWAYTLAGTSHVTGHADVAPYRPTGRNWLEEKPIVYALLIG